MLPADRKQKIVELVVELNGCSVDTLADQLDYSPSTIRRDLAELEEEGLIERTHGGALPVTTSWDIEYDRRNVQNMDQKAAIGERAVQEMYDERVVYLDAGTTVKEVAKRVPDDDSYTGVTNSPLLSVELARRDWKVKLTGGTYQPKIKALVGPKAERYLASMNFDLAFFGAAGIDPAAEITSTSELVAQIKRTVIPNAQRVVLIADASKFGDKSFVTSASLEEIDVLITDLLVEGELRAAFEDADVKIIDDVY